MARLAVVHVTEGTSARGRNGIFVPAEINVRASGKDCPIHEWKGTVEMDVFSSRGCDHPPIVLRLDLRDMKALALELLKACKEARS
jgi:hypothetical protein